MMKRLSYTVMNQRKLKTQSDLLRLDSLLGYTKLIQLCMVSIIIIYSAL